MSELLLDNDEGLIQWVRPDSDGFTVRTQYKGTQDILDDNARLRAEAPSSFIDKGETFVLAARLPMEVVDMMHRELGRMPTAEEMLKRSQERDFSKLKARDGKF